MDSCKDDPVIDEMEIEPIAYPDAIPATPQFPGDAAAGWDFLRYGNYVGGGIPLDLLNLVFDEDPENLLEREGLNATITPGFTAYDLNGVNYATTNCFNCHASKINGEYIVGLGDSFSDFTTSQEGVLALINQYMEVTYEEDSPEFQHYLPFGRGNRAAVPFIITDFKGVNPAFDLERAAVAHRSADMDWIDEAQYEAPVNPIGSDVPAWWLLKKKNALYYNGMGRGDFTKMLMQTSVVGLKDSSEARLVQEHFDDVLAFIQSIEAPVFPDEINNTLAASGKTIFEANCSACHGTYGENESYPNRLISIDVVGTDPAYAERSLYQADLQDWYNQSWFSTSNPFSEMAPERGYIAPPLDGVWATAPYLHNGSVPNLYTLLKSSERPDFWERDFESDTYDMDKIGWPYESKSIADNTDTYDSSIPGYGNEGHTFGDLLSEEDRLAVIEYLKNL